MRPWSITQGLKYRLVSICITNAVSDFELTRYDIKYKPSNIDIDYRPSNIDTTFIFANIFNTSTNTKFEIF